MPRQKSRHVDDPSKVGERLRVARERAGLSQRAIAFEGCSPAYISRIEAGERIPSLQVLRELGRQVGVSAEYLATGGATRTEVETALVEAEIALRLDDLDAADAGFAAHVDSTDPEVRARALEGRGQVAYQRGDAREAVALLEEALAESDASPADRPALADTLARAYAASGELAPAIALLERCVDEYGRRDDPIQYVRFAAILGSALTDTGDFGGAERVLAGALSRGREAADPNTRARLFWSQSRLLAEQGQTAAAERYARRTLETLRATEDTYALGHALEMLAHIEIELGRPAEALELLEEGEPLIRTAGTEAEIAHFRLERARALAALGEAEEAAGLAHDLAGRLRDDQPTAEGRSYLLLGEIFEQLGEDARARELYELAIERLEEQPVGRHLVVAYRRLAESLKRADRRDEALALLERALGAQEAVGRRLT
jgi:tetratricopeptide (TPR) repeat protein